MKTKLQEIFSVEKPLIGMCHLLGLPGRPRHDVGGGVDAVTKAVASDLQALQRGGVDGVLFCNEHDLPYSVRVGPEISAAMSAVIGRVRDSISVPFGVDLLWDARAALAVARATGAAFVREVFTGVYESDMGLLAPDFGELAAYRQMIGGDDIAIFANVTPEFSSALGGRTVGDRARSAAFLGVDALLVSGPMAGVSLDIGHLREVKEASKTVPVIANTGVNAENVGDFLAVADGVIVGTSLKVDGHTWNAVDPARVERMAERVRSLR